MSYSHQAFRVGNQERLF